MTAPVRRAGVPEATVGRLPLYLRALTALLDQGITSISSEELATLAGVRSAQVRKDLSHLGSYGVRGVGYDSEQLSAQISQELGLTQEWPVAIVGMGNLGRALAAYGGFTGRGFRIVALVDDDPEVVGTVVEGLTVTTLTALGTSGTAVAIGVITTPAPAAQTVAEQLVLLGVRSILNFAPGHLVLPDGVDVRGVDLATELQILAFHEQRRLLAISTHDPLVADVDAGPDCDLGRGALG
ncbi:redox-sensing transcriptional repressor Rex [Ornithinimicrobium cryptoxanthini]|uniref:Redox-sensing transcriptional repressor Rex n=1 Tax=Ornithinimicrobium cryptoxanthini TaxID=2934161 RepID=A0ABY4YPR4_9MICO|nr:redox-sensing transcriptional repressor Rex [Ornithinimicrobium cryptoxanthini]USQ78132.1 redox-sensing transcriptional repressor Rex [Ornithinimicrobium cryptoxanthini]